MKKFMLSRWTVAGMIFCMQAAAADDITQFDIRGIADEYLYTPGYAATPEPVVYKGETVLVRDVDYSVAYRDNRETGTAGVTVSGIGNYSGVLTRPFAIVNATRSVGYKLWDSNNGLEATTDPSEIREDGQVMHVQIKFDGAIRLDEAQAEALRGEFDIRLPGSLEPEDAGREVLFAVNRLDPTALDITMPSVGATAQTNCAIAIRATDAAGWITAVKDADGKAVNLLPVESVQPTGLALEKVHSATGTFSEPASATYRMASIPLVRSMNFLQARSNKSDRPDGALAREYFTIHSHSFYTMTPLTHFTTLTGAANVDTLQKAGYTLELAPVPGDGDNPCIRLTAHAPAEGEELSWVVYHYPYRAAADRKFHLAWLIDTAQVESNVRTAATDVLYDIHATADDVAGTIRWFDPPQEGNRNDVPPENRTASWTAGTLSGRTIVLRGLTPGSVVTAYQLNGQIVASLRAQSDTETIRTPAPGIYIVRVDDRAVKVPVK